MNPAVKKYLEIKEKELLGEKNEFLISQGLYEKKYSPENKVSSEYPYKEWSNEKQQYVYYKAEAFQTTDEEYQAILSAYESTQKVPEKEVSLNGVAIILNLIAWLIYVGAFLASLIMSEFLLVCLVVGFISGTTMLGFSQIVKLLHSINEKIN